MRSAYRLHEAISTIIVGLFLTACGGDSSSLGVSDRVKINYQRDWLNYLPEELRTPSRPDYEVKVHVIASEEEWVSQKFHEIRAYKIDLPKEFLPNEVRVIAFMGRIFIGGLSFRVEQPECSGQEVKLQVVVNDIMSIVLPSGQVIPGVFGGSSPARSYVLWARILQDRPRTVVATGKINQVYNLPFGTPNSYGMSDDVYSVVVACRNE